MALDKRLDGTTGVIVGGVRSGGPAEEAGLVPNDVVRSVDDEPVDSLEKFRDVYKDRVEHKKVRVMLNVERRDSRRFVLLKLSYEG